MRIQPIENPDSLYLKIAYWMTKRAFGRVITPLKVVYARMPKSIKVSKAISDFSRSGLTIPKDLQYLIGTYVAIVNGCGFCIDIGKSFAYKAKVSDEKLAALPDFRTSPLFSERERVAISYCEEVTRTKDVSDETFARMKEHFSDTEIVEITWMNALENYYNLINRPLGIESDGLCLLAGHRPKAAQSTEVR